MTEQLNHFTERRLQLVRGGYTPLPLFGKEPPIYGKNNKRKGFARWQELEHVTEYMIEMWERTWPDAVNTGVLTRQMPTLDADLLNEEAARAVEDHIRERYEERGYILPRIGKPPKKAFPFQTDKPFDKIVVNLNAANGSEEKIEFLANGQQVVVDGIHPDTKRPYRWFGGELGNIKRDDLPYISEEEAKRLVDEIVELLVRDFGYRRASERPRDRGDGKSNGSERTNTAGAADWKWLLDNIREGRELHDTVRDLAAKLIASGMSPAATVNHLRALMDASTAPHDERWQERYDDIPRAVETAVGKGFDQHPKADGSNNGEAASTLYYFNDCETIASKEWILKGLIARGEGSSWIAPPGVGKSGLLTAIAVHVAAQQDFHGFRSKGVCGVLYLAFERSLHTRRRMSVYARKGFKNLPICIRPGIINLMDPKCVEIIIAAMKEAEAHLGVPIGLVIIDTFAKGMAAGGGNESEAKDQGRCLGHLQAIRDTTGCHTATIHHTGKDVSKGARGSNAQVCDVDVEFTISESGGTRTLKVTKANDQPEGKVMEFTIKPEVLGHDEDGDEITVGIVAAADPAKPASLAPKATWTGKTGRLRDAINEVLNDDRGFDHHIPRGPTVKAVNVEDVQAVYRRTVVAVNPEPERPHRQADDALRHDIERAAAARLIGSHNIGQRGIIWMV